MKKNTGFVSSEESMGLLDGPGIRYVVFLQGCKLRCKYCHNPETWATKGGYEISADRLVEKIERYKSYFGQEGGVTFSGGEPLLQPEFLLECLKKCKEKNIHTAIDTAGFGFGDYEDILAYTDLVILDVKAVEEDEFKSLTGQGNKMFKQFLDVCQKMNKKLWIRQVIVPGINDDENHAKKLKKFISTIKNIEKIELLPYKTIGEHKYKQLKIKYALEGVENMDEKRCKYLENIITKKD